MNLYTFITFFYGSVGGAMSCIFFFFIAFRKIESILNDTVRKKAHKHAEFDAVAKEAAVVNPAKVETLCKIARFDDGIVSEAIQCRMVFYSGTIDIYQVDELRTLPDHRQVVVAEHMLGRINRSCVNATGERISKYHRHRNKTTRYAAIKGKCTVVHPKDGAPLFLEDPAALLAERLRTLKKTQHQQAAISRMRRRALRDGENLTDEEALRRIREMEAAASKETFFEHLATATGVVKLKDGAATTAGHGGHRASSVAARRAAVRQQRRRSSASTAGPAEEVPLSQWTCLAIKFPTRRVQERWLNLLQATPQSAQWHEFIRHLPKMDVFNILVARLFFENSRANTLHDLLEEKLKKKLVRVSKSLGHSLRGNIYLDGLDVGEEIPLISNVSDPTTTPSGDTEFDFDVLYRGGFFLKIRFAVCYRDLRLPDIVFSIKVLELAGRMRFVVGPPPTKKFWLGCNRPPQLRLDFTQEVASHDGILNTVLKLLPDMSQIASNVVTSRFFEDMVFPNLDDFPWPVLGADDSDSDAEGDDDDDASELKTRSDGDEAEQHGPSSSSREPMTVLHSEEIVVGGSSRQPRGERDSSQSSQPMPSFVFDANPTGRHGSQDRSGSNTATAAHDTPSPPPKPPLPPSSRMQRPLVDVPRRHSSSNSLLDGSMSAPGRSTQPPASEPRRGLHSRVQSTGSLSSAPSGLPPRPPRTLSEDAGKVASVPSTRAPGSATRGASHFLDFAEPEE